MATSGKNIEIGVELDAADAVAGANQAAQALQKVSNELDQLDAKTVDITVDTDAETAIRDLARVGAAVDDLEGDDVTIALKTESATISRDLAQLESVLDDLARQKRDVPVGFDITQILRDEKRVRKAIDDLTTRQAEIGVTLDAAKAQAEIEDLDGAVDAVDNRRINIDANSSGLESVAAGLDEIDNALDGVVPGLGRVTGLLRGGAGLAGGIAAIGVGAATAAIGLGQMAAEVEVTKIQLEALTGSDAAANQLFDELQTFAAETPFYFDQVTASARRLLAAGVDLDQVTDRIRTIGDISAASGADLEQVINVFAQIESRGRLAYEELQQLAEAGIPAFALLADELGVSIAELQELASAGQLGRREIELLYDVINQEFGGTTQSLAESFSGQVSTLQDTLRQAGQDLGRIFLPAMKDVVGQAQDGADAVATLADAMGVLADSAEDAGDAFDSVEGFFLNLQGALAGIQLRQLPIFGDLLRLLDLIGVVDQGIDALSGPDPLGFSSEGLAQVEGQVSDLEAEVNNLDTAAAGAAASGEQVTVTLQDLADAAETAQQDLAAVIDGLSELGAEGRNRIDLEIDISETRRDIEELAQQGVTIPADVTLSDIGGLSPEQQSQVQNLKTSIEQGLQGIEAQITAGEIDVGDVEGAWRDWVLSNRELFEVAVGAELSDEDLFALVESIGFVGGNLEPWLIELETAALRAELAELELLIANLSSSSTVEQLRSDFEGNAAGFIRAVDREYESAVSRISELRTLLGEGVEPINIELGVDESSKSAAVASVNSVGDAAEPVQIKVTASGAADAASSIRAVAGQNYQATIDVIAAVAQAFATIQGTAGRNYQAVITVTAAVAQAFQAIVAVASQNYQARITTVADVANAFRSIQAVALANYVAQIRASTNNASLFTARNALEYLARDRTATIFVRYQQVNSPPSTAARTLSAPAPAAAAASPTLLMPRISIAGREVGYVIRDEIGREREVDTLRDVMGGY